MAATAFWYSLPSPPRRLSFPLFPSGCCSVSGQPSPPPAPQQSVLEAHGVSSLNHILNKNQIFLTLKHRLSALSTLSARLTDCSCPEPQHGTCALLPCQCSHHSCASQAPFPLLATLFHSAGLVEISLTVHSFHRPIINHSTLCPSEVLCALSTQLQLADNSCRSYQTAK